MAGLHSAEVETRGKTILIIDDDERIRELAAFAATRDGIFADVATAANGAEAMRVLWQVGHDDASGLPDVILTDLTMPQMDGLELTRALKADPQTRSIPVFMFSSSGEPNDHERALAAGCDDFFEKPVSFDRLAEIMALIGAGVVHPDPAPVDRSTPRTPAPWIPTESGSLAS